MYIYVTQADIDEGERGNEMACPIAHAAARRFPSVNRVEMANETLYLDYEAFAVPPKASEFVGRYDEFGAEAVSPIRFSIERV